MNGLSRRTLRHGSVLGGLGALTVALSACGARTSLGGLFYDETEGGGVGATGALGGFGSGGLVSVGGGGAGSGGSGQPMLQGRAPDPGLDPPEFCTFDGWCGANADFVAISGTSPTDIWILANDTGSLNEANEPFDPNAPIRAAILHWDGFSWSATQPDVVPPGAGLRGISVAAPDDAWVIGDAGTVLRYQGAAWLPVDVPIVAQPTSVSASRPGSAWFVGRQRDQIIFDSSHPDITVAPYVDSDLGLTSVSTDEQGAWMVGPELIVRDGGFWATVPNPHQLTAIWGSDPTHAFAVGPDGALSRLEVSGGTIVQTYDRFNDIEYRAVWGRSPSDVWAVGSDGGVAHFDGAGWHASSRVTEHQLNGVWATADGQAWAVGDAGTFLAFEGDTWRSSQPALRPVRAIWGAAADDIWAAGEELIHWDGESWREVASPSVAEILAMSGTGVGDVWAVGRQRAILHWDGSSWSEGSLVLSVDLVGVWAELHNRVLAVSDSGSLFAYLGNGWGGPLEQGSVLKGISGNVAGQAILVGTAGRAVFEQGQATFEPGPDGAEYTLAFGDGQYVWTAGYVPWSAYKAGGTYPALGRWDGSAFVDHLEPSEPYPLPQNPIQAGWGRGTDNVWIGLPHVMHWDGSSWAPSSVGGAERVQALFGIDSDLWAITERGGLVRRKLP